MSEFEVRRRRARERYKPTQLTVLFIAEAPPSNSARYFYFDDVPDQDGLFVDLLKAVYGDDFKPYVGNRRPAEKRNWLTRLQEDGYWLLDCSEQPLDGAAAGGTSRVRSLEARSDLVERLRELLGEGYVSDETPVILIKATVYDAFFGRLAALGYNVIDKRIPFPGSGQQARFRKLFGEALGIARVRR